MPIPIFNILLSLAMKIFPRSAALGTNIQRGEEMQMRATHTDMIQADRWCTFSSLFAHRIDPLLEASKNSTTVEATCGLHHMFSREAY